ncbi:transposase, IS4 family [Hymenobacter psychrotolerans DSM 18569]|uniref:Transposase, IS4 family n=2 Tax=Hymenobacter psychrotolerans TaxID=344998 RepID=A0A1M7DRY2_9BACT|nr:transposase, IS4 family [Hymenobacter psychrotolerans DSM 18569]
MDLRAKLAGMEVPRRAYPSDVTDDEWGFLLPYLLLVREDAGQRQYPLRELFNALRYVVRTGCTWRYLPHDLPPWATCYQQWARWRDARVFEALTDDLRQVLRLNEARPADASAVIFDSRTLQSTPESGHRAGYDGAKRRKGSKVHVAVDTLGHLLAAVVTPANAQDRAQVGALAEEVQVASGQSVTLAYADQGYTGEVPAQAAEQHGIDLQVVKLGHTKRGFVLLPRRWVVERSLSWSARYKRLARDYERLAVSLQQLHYLAFVGLMLAKATSLNLLSGA